MLCPAKVQRTYSIINENSLYLPAIEKPILAGKQIVLSWKPLSWATLPAFVSIYQILVSYRTSTLKIHQ